MQQAPAHGWEQRLSWGSADGLVKFKARRLRSSHALCLARVIVISSLCLQCPRGCSQTAVQAPGVVDRPTVELLMTVSLFTAPSSDHRHSFDGRPWISWESTVLDNDQFIGQGTAKTNQPLVAFVFSSFCGHDVWWMMDGSAARPGSRPSHWDGGDWVLLDIWGLHWRVSCSIMDGKITVIRRNVLSLRVSCGSA